MAAKKTKITIESTTVKSSSLISKCNCQHPFQDKQYGKGMRLFTVGNKECCCTVCGQVKK